MELQKKLSCFYTEHYQRTVAFDEEDLGFTNKDQILKYVARDVVKDYENNIKVHFKDHLERFLTVLYSKKDLKGKSQEAKNAFLARMKDAKESILMRPGEHPTKRRGASEPSHPFKCELLEPHLKFLVPQRELKKNNACL